MKAQLLILLFFLSSVVATSQIIWDQPPLEENKASANNLLFERGVSLGVAAPRTFSAPSQSGFNFDSFAADDFILNSYSQIDDIWIAIAVDQLDSYVIDSVYIAVYPDIDGLPNYDPYNPDTPAPSWSGSFNWTSNDPQAVFPAPWNYNPVRKGAISVSVDFALLPGTYWLTMHFEISSSSISIPPAVWLPGKTQNEVGSPARLYIPGNNPSAGSSNAFGWYWNSLRRAGLGDLSFRFTGPYSQFTVSTNAIDDKWFYRCAGENHIVVNVSLDYFAGYTQSIELDVMFPAGSPLDVVWEGPSTLTNAAPDTSFRLRYFTQGNSYPFTLNFTDHTGNLVWLQTFTAVAVNEPLTAPVWVVRDDYGLIGGLFQWKPQSLSETFDFEIDEEGGDFSNPELSITLPGWLTSYRPVLSDYDPSGNVSQWGVRAQGYYNVRIRAVNQDCNDTSDWAVLKFQSDECEDFSMTFTNGTYNFQKGKFTYATTLLTDYGTIQDLRVRVRGFHQRWSDVGLAIKTPVVYQEFTVDVPLFAEDCDVSWDTHNPNSVPEVDYFEIYFVIGGAADSLCPRPPLEGEPSNSSHVQPWGAQVFEEFVLGQDKRGQWSLEWIDYGIGFPTNGKITDYDTILCSIPVPPREHIIYSGESKVRRGTVALYGP